MTISNLATSQYLTSKHWEQRDASQIRYIIPHHMAGRLSGAACAQYFCNNGLDNSANYCIGPDGDISCNVPEDFGAWTSSFSKADKYAITIEVSDAAKNDWHIPEAAQESLIRLMVDLIQRYPSLGGKAVFNPADEAEVVAAKRAYRDINASGNVLIHKWTSAYGTTCPEWHMIQILPDLCTEVNRRLAGQTRTLFEEAQYMIDNGINGNDRVNQAIADGFAPADVQAQIDLMLAKDKDATIKSIASIMPAVANGSKGDAVAILQHELARMGYYSGLIDGAAGAYTESAIKMIQSNWNKVYGGYAVDGSFGPQCWRRLLWEK